MLQKKNHFTSGQQVHFTIYPLPFITYFMPEKETCVFQFHTFENLNFQVGVEDFQHTPTKHVTPKNEKLDLGIL